MNESRLAELCPYILVIEDDQILNKVLCVQMEMAGCFVRSATTGRQALAMIEERVPSLLLLDVGLPDMNGIELVAEMRKNEKNSRIPLIIHSSFDITSEEEKQMRLGPTRLVTKATACSERLPQLVMELLEESKRLSGD